MCKLLRHDTANPVRVSDPHDGWLACASHMQSLVGSRDVDGPLPHCVDIQTAHALHAHAYMMLGDEAASLWPPPHPPIPPVMTPVPLVQSTHRCFDIFTCALCVKSLDASWGGRVTAATHLSAHCRRKSTVSLACSTCGCPHSDAHDEWGVLSKKRGRGENGGAGNCTPFSHSWSIYGTTNLSPMAITCPWVSHSQACDWNQGPSMVPVPHRTGGNNGPSAAPVPYKNPVLCSQHIHVLSALCVDWLWASHCPLVCTYQTLMGMVIT
jgi:hypothetical protein